jgi:hypothetical protein
MRSSFPRLREPDSRTGADGDQIGLRMTGLPLSPVLVRAAGSAKTRRSARLPGQRCEVYPPPAYVQHLHAGANLRERKGLPDAAPCLYVDPDRCGSGLITSR